MEGKLSNRPIRWREWKVFLYSEQQKTSTWPVLNLPRIFNLWLFPTRKCCEIKVTISSQEESKNNQSTFNWGPSKKYLLLHFYLLYSSQDIPAVQLRRYPRCALKRTGEDGEELDLNKHLKVRLGKWIKKQITKYYSELPSGFCDFWRKRRHQPSLLPRAWPGQVYWISQAC